MSGLSGVSRSADLGRGLRVRDITVRFDGHPAVAEATFHVKPGEILGLLGPSGCGKSTLLRVIMGLQSHERGGVFWNGESLESVPVHERQFGLMFQDGQLFPHRNVAGNISYGLRGSGLSRPERDARVAQMLELVGLPDFGQRQIVHLSGGERQRVALARALAPEPRLLLLDEPLSALDRDLRERLAGDLRRVLRETETTAIFVTHDHDEAFTIADRVAVMRAGRIEQIGTPHSVWRAPANEAVAGFLGYRWFIARDERGDWRRSTARNAVENFAEDAGATEAARAPDTARVPEVSRAPQAGEVLALHPGSFTLAGSGAEVASGAPSFLGRVTAHLGAYREGNIIAVATAEIGELEVHVPGEHVPALSQEVTLQVRTDAVGRIQT